MHSNSQSRNFAPFSILIDFRSDFSKILGKWPSREYLLDVPLLYFHFLLTWAAFSETYSLCEPEGISYPHRLPWRENAYFSSSAEREAFRTESGERREQSPSAFAASQQLLSAIRVPLSTVFCCASLLLFTDSSVFLTFSCDIRSPPDSQVSFSEKFFAQFDSYNFWMYGYFS